MGLGNMARASRGEFEDVDEQALVGVTGVIGQHPLVDVLLSTLALVAGSQKTASRVRRQTSLQPGGLSVVMSIDNDPPVSVDIPGSLGHGI